MMDINPSYGLSLSVVGGRACIVSSQLGIHDEKIGGHNMTTEQIYATNMEALRQGAPDLAKNIENLPLTNVQFIELPRQNQQDESRYSIVAFDTTLQQWVPLTGANPELEAKNDADALYNPTAKAFPLMGFGAGFFPVEIKKKLNPGQRVAFFETNPCIFKAALHICDIRPLLEGGAKVNLFIGGDLVAQCEHWWLTFETFEKMYIGPVLRSAFTNVFDKFIYDALCEKSGEMIRHHLIGLATWARHGHEMQHNDVSNLPDYVSNPGMEKLRNLWQGKPVVCVAAGPSLKKNLRLLCRPEYRNKVCVISVGTVLKLLLSFNIRPDIVTTIDFQRLNYTDQFKGYELPTDIPLVYLHSTYAETVKRWPGPKFVATNDSEIVQWLKVRNIYTEDKGSAAQSQTVAHLNVFVALTLGAKKIILIGQDLSMPKDEHHAPGAMAQDTAPKDAEDSYYEIDDMHGNKIYTRHSFASMTVVFSRIFISNPEIEFFNCSEMGVNIVGSVNAPLSQVLSEFPEQKESLIDLRFEMHKKYLKYTPDYGQINNLLSSLRENKLQITDFLRQAEIALDRYAMIEKGDLEFNEINAQPILLMEQVFQQCDHIFNMAATCNFNIIAELSKCSLYKAWDTPEEYNKFKMEIIANILKMIIEILPRIYFGINKAHNRLEYFTSLSKDVRFNKKRSFVTKDLKWGLVRQQYSCVLASLDNNDTGEKLAKRILKMKDDFMQFSLENRQHYFQGD